jgi:peptidoglycan/LPS O-acetylase OafA/YrhL
VVGAFVFAVPYSPLQVAGESFLVHRWPGVSSSFNAINGPDWSISTEWLSNILFPIFVGLTLRSSFLAVATGVICLATIFILDGLNDGSLDLTKANSVMPTVRCFAEFGLGMLLYRHRSKGSFRFLPILASGLLMAALISKAPDSLTLLPMAGLLLAVGDNSGVLRWALSGRPIYLVHLPILRVVDQAVIGSGISGLFAQFVTVVATFGAVLLVSAMTYSFVEIPGRDKAKVFAQTLVQRPSNNM